MKDIRLSKQTDAIVERLRRGPATNAELAAIALKYTSRVSDARARGYDIRATQVEGARGTFQYELATA